MRISTKYPKSYYTFPKHKKFSNSKKYIFRFVSLTPLLSKYYFILNKLLTNSKQRGGGKIKLLDIGCAHGYFLNFIHNIQPNFELYGMDMSDVGDMLPKNVKFINKNIIADKLPSKKFDFIVSLHLIEHLNVSDVPVFFDRAKKMLKKNGVLFVLTPRSSYEFYNCPTHIRPYNKTSLSSLFKFSGFKTYRTFDNDEFNFPINKIMKSMKVCFGFGIK